MYKFIENSYVTVQHERKSKCYNIRPCLKATHF